VYVELHWGQGGNVLMRLSFHSVCKTETSRLGPGPPAFSRIGDIDPAGSLRNPSRCGLPRLAPLDRTATTIMAPNGLMGLPASFLDAGIPA
jgi:hypothetical protein